jgi:hypothetical protein
VAGGFAAVGWSARELDERRAPRSSAVSCSYEDDVVPCWLLVLISGVEGIGGGATTCRKRDMIAGDRAYQWKGSRPWAGLMVGIATGIGTGRTAQSETISGSAPVVYCWNV